MGNVESVIYRNYDFDEMKKKHLEKKHLEKEKDRRLKKRIHINIMLNLL